MLRVLEKKFNSLTVGWYNDGGGGGGVGSIGDWVAASLQEIKAGLLVFLSMCSQTPTFWVTALKHVW
jgi:hypothetical protein